MSSKNKKFKKSSSVLSKNDELQKINNESKEYVDEHFKISIHQEISEFLKSFDEGIQFPPSLTKSQRAYIHEYVKKLGLISKSYGRPSKRCIIVYKQVNKTNKTTPWLCLTAKSKILIKEYVNKFNLMFLIDDNVSAGSNFLNSKDYCDKNISLGFSKNLGVPPPSACSRNLFYERCCLPIYQYRKDILQTISKNQVAISITYLITKFLILRMIF